MIGYLREKGVEKLREEKKIVVVRDKTYFNSPIQKTGQTLMIQL